MNIEELKELSTQVRRDILRMVFNANSGHPGGAMGSTEFMVCLYNKIMNHNPKFSMNAKKEDIFFLSNGHISTVLYSVLARCGYFDIKELNTFRKLNSRVQGHPSISKNLEGIRMASGSLGQGISVAIGSALTKKINQENSLIYVLCGDGELQEGQIWESVMYAGSNSVDNLICTIDYNRQQIDGTTDNILSLGNLSSKFKAFNWEVLELEKGNDIEQVIKYLKLANSKTRKGKPVCIIMKTEMGKGVDFMEGTNEWHGKVPNSEQMKNALSQLPKTKFKDF